MRFIALSIIIAVFLQSFNNLSIVLDYYLNKSVYAKNCVNKDRPKLHCNGKCQMMQKIKQEENKDRQNPERKSENKTQVLSSKSFFGNICFYNIKSLFTKRIIFPNQGLLTDRSYDIFHPPQA